MFLAQLPYEIRKSYSVLNPTNLDFLISVLKVTHVRKPIASLILSLLIYCMEV